MRLTPPAVVATVLAASPAFHAARSFFSALATEPPGVRAAVQEATSSLALAFRCCPAARYHSALSIRSFAACKFAVTQRVGRCRDVEGEPAAALYQLLLGSVAAQQPEAVRMAALQWAIKLFPFGHVPARYLCVLGAADPRFQIAESALEGLQPSKFAAGAGSAAAGSLPAYPAFGAVLEYLQQQVPELKRQPPEGALAPALPPKVRPVWRARAGKSASRFP